MPDRVTANLPSNDFDRTAAFYGSLGFKIGFKDDGWMILSRGPLELEFFPCRVEPSESCFSACLRVDDLDALYADFSAAEIPAARTGFPRMSAIETAFGLRLFTVIDPDGSLLRCIDR